VDEAVEKLISRAADPYGLMSADIRPRIDAIINKYLPEAKAGAEVKSFVDEIRSDDLCLIVACERGDEKAWERLVVDHDKTVKSAARKISGNAEDADDLASSIWAELYGLRQDVEGNRKSKLAYYSGCGSLGGWLRAVVAQLAVDQFRKGAKYVQIEEDRDFDNLASEAAENGDHHLTSRGDDPEEALTAKRTQADVVAALRSAIEALEAEDRLIMKMYYFDNLKLKDIAAAFGYHEATASRRLTRVQCEIRKGVESELRTSHGWSESEVKRHLTDTATRLGITLETMFALMVVTVLVQDLWS
jgi:RNA polymerase sigma-70 factor (ECF subfamily)